MSDPYFCRLRVTGPDVAEFYRLLWTTEWADRGEKFRMFDWSEPLHLNPGRNPPTKHVGRIWYNTEVSIKKAVEKTRMRVVSPGASLAGLQEVVLRGNAPQSIWAFAKTKPLSNEQVAAWQDINDRFFKKFCGGISENRKRAHFNEEHRLQRAVIGPHDPSDVNTLLRYAHMPRVGPGIFDHLSIDVQIVGWMYSADTRSGKYSERLALHNGVVLKDEYADSLKFAKKHMRKADRE